MIVGKLGGHREGDDIGLLTGLDPGAPLAEPAQRRVGQHRLVASRLDEQAVVGVEMAAQLRLDLIFTRVRANVPSLLQRAGP